MNDREESQTKTVARRSRAEKIFHTMARMFNGVHWAFGITTLPATATPREERSFVLMWVGLIVFMIVFLTGFFYFLGRFLSQAD